MVSNIEGLLIFGSITAFALGVVAELIGFNTLSCVLISIMLIGIFVLILPKLLRRFKRKTTNKKWVNFLNFVAILFFSFIIAYLMASLIYFAIWGYKFWDSYEMVLYPTVLIYLLLEVYLNFLIDERYKYHDE